jgi:hypothetical protein
VEFTVKNGATCGVPVSVNVAFTGDPATGDALFEVECGGWTALCVKDEQHSLTGTMTLSPVGRRFEGDATLVLLGGDVDNNDKIDIIDVAYLVYQFGEPAADGGCPWDETYDADFSNNGFVDGEDYTFLVANWEAVGTCDCPARLPARERLEQRVPASTAVLPAARLPAAVASGVDLNRDGSIDYKDIERFERQHGLPNALSWTMKRDAAVRTGGALRRPHLGERAMHRARHRGSPGRANPVVRPCGGGRAPTEIATMITTRNVKGAS